MSKVLDLSFLESDTPKLDLSFLGDDAARGERTAAEVRKKQDTPLNRAQAQQFPSLQERGLKEAPEDKTSWSRLTTPSGLWNMLKTAVSDIVQVPHGEDLGNAIKTAAGVPGAPAGTALGLAKKMWDEYGLGSIKNLDKMTMKDALNALKPNRIEPGEPLEGWDVSDPLHQSKPVDKSRDVYFEPSPGSAQLDKDLGENVDRGEYGQAAARMLARHVPIAGPMVNSIFRDPGGDPTVTAGHILSLAGGAVMGEGANESIPEHLENLADRAGKLPFQTADAARAAGNAALHPVQTISDAHAAIKEAIQPAKNYLIDHINESKGVTPDKSLIVALRPKNSSLSFKDMAPIARPLIADAAKELGIDVSDIQSMDDAKEHAVTKLVDQQNSLMGNRPFTIDGTPVAEAIKKSLPEIFRTENPDAAAAIDEWADKTYAQDFDSQRFNQLRKDSNKLAAGYQGRMPSEQLKLDANVDTAIRNARVDALRDTQMSALDDLSSDKETGNGQAMRQVNRGLRSLLVVGDALDRRFNVVERQAIQNMPQQVSKLVMAGNVAKAAKLILTGSPLGAAGELASGLGGVGVVDFFKELNSANGQIASAFRRTTERPATERPATAGVSFRNPFNTQKQLPSAFEQDNTHYTDEGITQKLGIPDGRLRDYVDSGYITRNSDGTYSIAGENNPGQLKTQVIPTQTGDPMMRGDNRMQYDLPVGARDPMTGRMTPASQRLTTADAPRGPGREYALERDPVTGAFRSRADGSAGAPDSPDVYRDAATGQMRRTRRFEAQEPATTTYRDPATGEMRRQYLGTSDALDLKSLERDENGRFKKKDAGTASLTPIARQMVSDAGAEVVDPERIPRGSASLFVDHRGNVINANHDHWGTLDQSDPQFNSKNFRVDANEMSSALERNRLARVNMWGSRDIAVEAHHGLSAAAIDAIENIVEKRGVKTASWDIEGQPSVKDGTPEDLLRALGREKTATGGTQTLFDRYRDESGGDTSLSKFDKWMKMNVDEDGRFTDREKGAVPLFSNNPGIVSKVEKNIEDRAPAAAPARQFLNIAGNVGGDEARPMRDWLAQMGDKKVSLQDVTARSGAPKMREHWINGKADIHKNATFDDWYESQGFVRAFDEYPEDRQRQMREEYERDIKEAARNVSPKFSHYKLPGGANYREYVATLPGEDGDASSSELGPPPGFTVRRATRADVDAMTDNNGAAINDAPKVNDWIIAESHEPMESHLGSAPGHLSRQEAMRQMREDLQDDEQWPDNRKNSIDYQVPGGHLYGDAKLDNNRLFHMRMDDRAVDGDKALFLEELQSDWHQAGRDKGYKSSATMSNMARASELKLQLSDINDRLRTNPNIPRGEYDRLQNQRDELADEIINLRSDKSSVPDAPYKKSWAELGMKRMLQEAAEKDYDQLAWTTGKQQADRYSLRKQVDKLTYYPEDNTLNAFKNGKQVLSKIVSSTELPEVIGKEASEKLLASKRVEPRGGLYDDNGVHFLSGQDLDIGGEGMRGFYDKIIPQFMDKYLKKYGVKTKLVDARLGTPSTGPTVDKVWSVKITPEMRRDFSRAGGQTH